MLPPFCYTAALYCKVSRILGPPNGRISSLDLLFPTRLLLWQQEAEAEAEDAAVRDDAGINFCYL